MMIRVPNCCGERMRFRENRDEVFCPKCGKAILGIDLHRAARVQQYTPIAVSKEVLDAAASNPSLVDEVRKRSDELIARCLDQLAHPVTYVKMAAGGIGIRPDPTVPPGEIRVLKPPLQIAPEAKARRDAVVAFYRPKPVDLKYDGITLRVLLERDRFNRGELAQRYGDDGATPFEITPAQRAAVSAHWSAQLRAKVQASRELAAERDRLQVVLEVDEP